MKLTFPQRLTIATPVAACLALLLATAPHAAGTAEPGPVLEPGPGTAGGSADEAPAGAPRALRAELNARLAEVFAAEREQVAVLRERLGRAADHAEALALQAAIAGAKEQAERDCLEIQLDIARRAGWSGAVAALEADLAALAAVAAGTAAEQAPATPATGDRP